jgi:predicted nuclease of restriction endonuclease-like RecB superfamily
MHKRPRLEEALAVLEAAATISTDAVQAIEQYHEMRAQGLIFEACRMVVDIVDHHYHLMSTAGVVNG